MIPSTNTLCVQSVHCWENHRGDGFCIKKNEKIFFRTGGAIGIMFMHILNGSQAAVGVREVQSWFLAFWGWADWFFRFKFRSWWGLYDVGENPEFGNLNRKSPRIQKIFWWSVISFLSPIMMIVTPRGRHFPCTSLPKEFWGFKVLRKSKNPMVSYWFPYSNHIGGSGRIWSKSSIWWFSELRRTCEVPRSINTCQTQVVSRFLSISERFGATWVSENTRIDFFNPI